MKLVISLLLVLNLVGVSSAQTLRTANYGSITGAIGNSQGSISIDYFHLWRLGTSKKIEIGFGTRFTSYFGNKQYYSSAPASLASDVKKTDSILLVSPQVNALNVAISLGYRLSPKIGLGFNIDALGFTVGSRQNGTYLNGAQGGSTSAKPTSFNVLLVGHNDRGTLNSEFYARYFFTEKLALKVAYQYLFTEYTTDTKIQTTPEANDRFRNTASLFSLGITKRF